MEKGSKPLLDALKLHSAQGKINMHMPGHKEGRLFSKSFKDQILRYDLTELRGLDDLHRPKGAILESMQACAKAFGAKESYFLVNGSTSGVHTMLAACLSRGDRLLVARNCHISVLNGLILFGIQPVFVMPRFDEEWQIALPADIDTWRKALEENPDVKGALVTSPDYYGLCAPLAELADLLHQCGKFLMVDEAHGAHFAFSDQLPPTALAQGADICVQSLHKTLPAFTQAALLHIGSHRVSSERVRRSLSMLTTTSPSYMLMASMDYARDFGERKGEESYKTLIGNLHAMKQELSEMEKLRLLPDMLQGYARDATRIVVDTTRAEIDGSHLYRRLDEEYDILAEMADECRMVFITSPADSENELATLKNALLDLDRKLMPRQEKRSFCVFDDKPVWKSLPSLSDYLENTAYIPLESAAGFVSASMVTPYPPGIPVLCPGELITENTLLTIQRLVQAGNEVRGLGENSGLIRVMIGNLSGGTGFHP